MDFLYTFLTFLQPGILWPDLAPLRPMLVITIVAGITGLLRGGASSARDTFRHPAFISLSLFILAQVASLHYGGVGEMMKELEYWHVYLLFVVVSLWLLTTVEALHRYVWGMMAGSMVVVWYGIYAVLAELPAAVGGRAGAYGMYENHNDYSFIIVMVLPFLVMIRREETAFLRRAFLGLSAAACVIGIALSLSRGGALVLVLELILLVVATSIGRARTLLIAMILVFGVGAVAFQFARRAANQAGSYTAEDAESSRYELWKSGLQMFKTHPLLGVGSRRFGEFGRDYYELSHDQIGKNSHNTYIEVLATSGLLGLLPFLLMLRAMIRELRARSSVQGHEGLDAIRRAALISITSILVRGLLDAKPWDWSIYVICSIAISTAMLRHGLEQEDADPDLASVGVRASES